MVADQTYSFSYRAKRPYPRLLRRPWWKFWGSDSVVMEQQWTRVCVTGLTKSEAQWTINTFQSREHGHWLCKLLGGDIDFVQLEHELGRHGNLIPSTYISTGAKHVG